MAVLKHLLFLLETESGTGGDGGEGNGSQSQEGGSGAPGGQGTQSGTEGTGQVVSASELAEARREAAKYRTERNNLAKRVEELEGASKTETEKAVDQAKKAEERATAAEQRARRLQVQVLAGDVGIADSKAKADAASLLDWDSIEDPDDAGQVTKALKQLVKDRPYLLGNVAGGADGGAGSGGSGNGGTTMNQRIREAAGRG